MPVITLFQTKGGTGKTTAAFVLAELLGRQQKTTVIDADQNEPFQDWLLAGGEGHGFEIVSFEKRDDKGNRIGGDVDRVKEVPAAIMQATENSVFVIVDTEGSANAVSARAVAMSDFVIVTSTGSPLDQKHAKKAIQFIRAWGKKSGREIPYKVLFTRQKAVAVSRTIKKGIENMTKAGVPVFDHSLIERDAFMAIFGYNSTLFNLPEDEVSGPDKAYFNAKLWSLEVLKALKPEAAPKKDGKLTKNNSTSSNSIETVTAEREATA